MGDEILKLDELISSKPRFPLSMESAQKAVAILKEHFRGILRDFSVEIPDKRENVISIEFSKPCRPNDVKAPSDQFIYSFRGPTYWIPNKLEVFFFPDQKRLRKFFQQLRKIGVRINRNFMIFLNGIDPPEADEMIANNSDLFSEFLQMAIWVSISAASDSRISKLEFERKHLEFERKHLEFERKRDRDLIESLRNENERLRANQKSNS